MVVRACQFKYYRLFFFFFKSPKSAFPTRRQHTTMHTYTNPTGRDVLVFWFFNYTIKLVWRLLVSTRSGWVSIYALTHIHTVQTSIACQNNRIGMRGVTTSTFLFFFAVLSIICFRLGSFFFFFLHPATYDLLAFLTASYQKHKYVYI